MSGSTLAEPAESARTVKCDFKRILFATDCSDASERALSYALAFASRYDSEVFLLHATEPQPREAIPMDPLPRELDRERLQAERQIRHLTKSARFKHISYVSIVERGRVCEVLSDVIDR